MTFLIMANWVERWFGCRATKLGKREHQGNPSVWWHANKIVNQVAIIQKLTKRSCDPTHVFDEVFNIDSNEIDTEYTKRTSNVEEVINEIVIEGESDHQILLNWPDCLAPWSCEAIWDFPYEGTITILLWAKLPKALDQVQKNASTRKSSQEIAGMP